jgi:hypothetical protein
MSNNNTVVKNTRLIRISAVTGLVVLVGFLVYGYFQYFAN